MNKQKIAVIGSGISGLSIAWLLREQADVVLFERDKRFGGHANTVTVDDETAGSIPVDTGFIVLNDRNYPNLLELFAILGVEVFDTVMSFSVSEQYGRYEYGGAGAATLFAQKKNLLSLQHYRMLLDIVRFNKLAKASLEQPGDQTIGEFLSQHGFSNVLAQRYLLPMAAAIWSCPLAQIESFPAASLCRFFENHGLLDLRNRPQWHSVAGGSRVYVERVLDQIGRDRCRLQGVETVHQVADQWRLCGDGFEESFDQVVFACHADQAMGVIGGSLTDDVATVLGAFRYQKNVAWLHTDETLMPKSQSVWSAWNYLTERDGREQTQVSVSYWMNLLQRLSGSKDYFVTLNPLREPAADKQIRTIEYEHPIFDAPAIVQQKRLADIQGQRGLWFCGAWCANGFHEDGLVSALAVFNKMGYSAPWQSARAAA